MEYIPLSPIFICAHAVSSECQKQTLDKVETYINTHELTVPFNEVVKTTYNYNNGTKFLDDCNLVELKQEIISCATDFLTKLDYNFKKELNINSWLNVFDKNTLESDHTHYNSIISGCYYVDSDNTSESGNFYITDQIPQREQNRSYYKLSKTDHHFITPTPGNLILFESWVRHGVLANKTDKKRISIAFNID